MKTVNDRSVRVRGVCGGIGSSWDWRLKEGDPNPRELALLVDANALLITSAEFGCVLHEPVKPE